MLTEYIYTLLLPVIPAAGALICLFMTGLVRAEHGRRLLKRTLIVFFLSEMGLWLTTIFYSQSPGIFVYLSALTYLMMLLTQVAFFHFVFRITQLRAGERFSSLHYILPFAIAGIQGIWTWLVPFDVTLKIIESQGELAVDYPVYSAYFLFKIKMRMLYSIFYTVWALVRIYRYRKAVVDYSSDEGRTTLTWLKLLVFIALILVFLPLSMVFHERSYFFTATFLLPLMAILLLVQFGLLCFNFITSNYVRIVDGVSEKEIAGGINKKKTPECQETDAMRLLDRNKFETYMHSHKPYLNSQLRIIDLAAMLGTNRSYLSAFINATYGVNFSQLINRYRLEEFRRLEKEKPGLNKAELAVTVGFGSYRTYARIANSSSV